MVLSGVYHIYHRHADMSEDCRPTFMSSSSSPLLPLPEDCDRVEKDDELWTQYVSIAADADKQMIDEWMKLVDTVLVFVGFSTPVSHVAGGSAAHYGLTTGCAIHRHSFSVHPCPRERSPTRSS
jgi:hypothetical protein